MKATGAPGLVLVFRRPAAPAKSAGIPQEQVDALVRKMNKLRPKRPDVVSLVDDWLDALIDTSINQDGPLPSA